MTRWTPILVGVERDEAWRAIAAIAADLAPAAAAQETPGADRSLADGGAGLALFFHYLGMAEGPNSAAFAARDRLLKIVADALGSEAMDPSLYSGFSGVAWVLQQIGGWKADAPDDPLVAIDEALLIFIERNTALPLDLIAGLVGVGVYLLKRAPRPAATAALGRLLDLIGSRAEPKDEGIAWRAHPETLDEFDRALYPSGRFDLGVAHGAPGILGLLRGIEEARIEPERARGLIDAGAPWLLAQATGATSPRFPYWVAEDGPSPPSRVAWCYGDLGIAAVLLANGRDRWWDAGLEIARDVAQCPIEAAGVCDAGLCHGAAGAAHIFNRLFHLTGDPALRDTARVWCVEALRMRQPGAGVGGFYALVRDQDLNDQPLADPGLLNGAAGIGLALLAAITDHAPDWDRAMLISASRS